MREVLRPRPGQPCLTLRCSRCGVSRDIEDDGRRVHHAQVHASACAEPPEAGAGDVQLKLISSDILEMQTTDGVLWFEIRRTVTPRAAPPAAAAAR